MAESSRLYDQTVPQKQMKARVKSTGEIIEVRAFMDHDGNTTWLEDATNTEYYLDELVFLPAVIGKMQPINSNEPFEPESINAFPPMEVSYDPQSMTARFVQDMHIRMTKEVVEAALTIATDKQLRAELKRRADERKALRSEELRCRNCKHCIEGYTSKRSLDYGCKTSVCGKKLKFQCEAYALYYATRHTQKACDMFELK